jgi:hypothetical protein
MIQVTPQMRVLVAIEPVDGRKGIDSLAQPSRPDTMQPCRKHTLLLQWTYALIARIAASRPVAFKPAWRTFSTTSFN